MLHEIDHRGNKLIKIRCDTCGWVKWIKPKALNKFPECPQCRVKSPQETSGRLEIPEPHKESLVPFEVIEVIDNNPEKHIETEVIKKPSKKHK